jgi:hypothetical protein
MVLALSGARATGQLRWKPVDVFSFGGKRTDCSTSHPIERDSHGGSRSTPARSRFMRVQIEPSGSVMTHSITATCPPARIRNREQGLWIVIRGRNGTDYNAMGEKFP